MNYTNDQLDAMVIAGEYIRANGNCLCTICGFTYKSHPVLFHYPWLHQLCDGQLVKL